MIVQLSQSYPSRYGVPVIKAVENRIFTLRYFTYCMDCTYCHNWCCSWGADIDARSIERIVARTEAFESFSGIPRSRWFKRHYADEEMPGGCYSSTRVAGGACVFLSRTGKGCLLHSYAAENRIDYHDLKPIVCCLFPLTFCEGVLVHADEVEERSLVCLDEGPTLYSGIRDELAYYFGEGFVAELDSVEADARRHAGQAASQDLGSRSRHL